MKLFKRNSLVSARKGAVFICQVTSLYAYRFKNKYNSEYSYKMQGFLACDKFVKSKRTFYYLYNTSNYM